MFSSNTSAVSADANYIEDVFSTWLYTGNGSTQTITNGIDLSTKGGLVWLKTRSVSQYHYLFDTLRGPLFALSTNATDNSYSIGNTLTAFNSNGFSLGLNSATNGSGTTFASWTFREQPKFFDVVTYTGNGTAGRTVAHSLGSVPGCIIVKRTDAANGWPVYHRAMDATPQNYQMRLNATDGKFTTSPVSRWNNTAPTSTVFTLSDNDEVNGNGATYVAYLFAHDAGGFGLTGTDNVISCGSFTTGGSYTVGEVNLGYEPQWAMIKRVDSTGNWSVADIMRGMPGGNNFNQKTLNPNLSDAEQDATVVSPNATGFSYNFLDLNATYIYIAIRRGPMKTPTTGTSVFTPLAYTGNGTNNRVITGVGFPLDLMIQGYRSSGNDPYTNDRLRGASRRLFTDVTNSESVSAQYGPQSYSMDGYTQGSDDASAANINGNTYINWLFRRAPGFFDVVCYTGTGSARTVNHNLGVVPEMMIVKVRNGSGIWMVYHAALGNTGAIYLNDSDIAYYSSTYWNSTTPTSSVFSLGTSGNTNGGAGQTYVNYLFASCPGVSKVGSYTGTGALQTINCGFTGGARFVLIKRTDSTGDWFTYDSARGISSGNDPYLLLNSTAAEVTGTNYVDTTSVGFQVTAAAPAGLNANGGTYIFLAIA